MKIGSVIFGNPFIFRKNYEGACFFLEVGFVCADTEWVKRADMFRQQFEELLRDTVHVEIVCLLGKVDNRKPDTRAKISVETEELKKVKKEK